MRRKSSIFNDQSNANYNVENKIIYYTEVLKCNIWDYNDAYIFMKGDIALIRN